MSRSIPLFPLASLLLVASSAAASGAPPPDCSTSTTYNELVECLYPRWMGGGDQTCDLPGRQLAPCDGEEHHWVARPFQAAHDVEIAAVRYTLYGGTIPGVGWDATCDTTLAHRVQLLIGTDSLDPGAPESNPVVAAEWDISASRAEGTRGTRTITLYLDGAIDLDQGEHAFLSVQYAGDVEDGSACSPDDGTSLCMAACDEDGPSFWSFSDSAPYSWTDLRDIGVSELPDMGILLRPRSSSSKVRGG